MAPKVNYLYVFASERASLAAVGPKLSESGTTTTSKTTITAAAMATPSVALTAPTT